MIYENGGSMYFFIKKSIMLTGFPFNYMVDNSSRSFNVAGHWFWSLYLKIDEYSFLTFENM